MRTLIPLALVLLMVPRLDAQQQVSAPPNIASYATAAVNPTIGVIEAFRSQSPACHLARLGLTAGIITGFTLPMKRFIVSPRPCVGCGHDGMPSGHTAYSTIGAWSNKTVGFSMVVSTGELRMAAHRHTAAQVLVGGLLGAGAEWAGQAIPCR